MSNTCLDGSKIAVLDLPSSLGGLNGRILSLEDMCIITDYYLEVKEVHNVITFDSEDFIGITLDTSGYTYCVYALDIYLKSGPEYYINSDKDKVTLKLRKEVETYLNSHPELGISIDQFK
jgi:hypothetical protein